MSPTRLKSLVSVLSFETIVYLVFILYWTRKHTDHLMVSAVMDTCNPRVTSALPAFKVEVGEKGRRSPSPFLYKGKLKVILRHDFYGAIQGNGSF